MESYSDQQIVPALGRYEILGEIGRGGMSVVYHSYEAALDRPIALKLLAPDLVHRPGFAERLRREAISMARLRHPNIALLYDFGQLDGCAFLALEYIAGPSLRDLLETAPPSVESKLAILQQIAAGLAYAHCKGIVHHDVKPSNILVEPDGRAVLVDFGLASIVESADTTVEGALLGTPHYMSPEQALGYPADERSDQYALAAVAYELLTGVPPFYGRSAAAIVHAHIYEPPAPPTELRPTLPIVVNEILLRALAKEPHRRYPSVTDFVAELVAAFGRVAPARLPPPRRSLWVWALLGTLLVVAVILLATVAVVPEQRNSVRRADAPLPPPAQLLWRYETPLLGAAPPVIVGNRVVVAGLDGNLTALDVVTGTVAWRRRGDAMYSAAAASASLLFVGTADGELFGLSPHSGGVVWRTRVTGGLRLAPAVVGERLIAVTDKGYIYLVDAQSGGVVWSRPLAVATQPPTVGAGRVFIVSGDSLAALDEQNGVVEWQFTADGTITTAPTLHGAELLIGTERGVLHRLRVAGGAEILRFQAPGALSGPPVVAGRLLVMSDRAGFVTALRASDAALIWRFDAGAAVAPPLYADGLLLVGAADGMFYTLDTNGNEVARVRVEGSISAAPLRHEGITYLSARSLYALGP